jgi:Ca2+-binding RTX toxin-like protein
MPGEGGEGEASGPPVLTQNPDGTVDVDLGTGHDKARIRQESDGSLVITTQGGAVTVAPELIEAMTIRGNAGIDDITVEESVRWALRIDAGDGHDRITCLNDADDVLIGGNGNDTIVGAGGADFIDGGAGDDYLQGDEGDDTILTGSGRNVAYGLNGNDQIQGGDARDYLDGGAGNDSVFGGAGDDQVFGGRGDDQLRGDGGDDAVAGGAGVDAVDGSEGVDSLFVQADDAVVNLDGDAQVLVDMTTTNAHGGAPGSSFLIDGSDTFKIRVQSDLDALGSVPTGRAQLTLLDNTGRKLRIEDAGPTAGNSASPEDRAAAWMRPDGTPGSGTNGTTFYNTQRVVIAAQKEWQTRPPVVGFFHETVHLWNYATGTLIDGTTDGVNSRELAAVGLPYDHDRNPNTQNLARPPHIAENDLRDELKLPTRTEY